MKNITRLVFGIGIFCCLAAAYSEFKDAFAGLHDVRIEVSIRDQKLKLIEAGKIKTVYRISTSRYGTGNREGSHCTPLGLHRIKEKIGDGAPLNTIFVNRVSTGQQAVIDAPDGAKRDWVTTRILWLEGLEEGLNRGKGIDSYERFIYIHGTAEESRIGIPASRGCIRMKNRDVRELFDRVPVGTEVKIY